MDQIYINNAATSWPKAPGMETDIYKAVVSMPKDPARSVPKTSNVLMGCRKELSRLLGVKEPSRIVLTTSATIALNMVLHGLIIQQGTRVLTSVAEHNSVLRPLSYLVKNKNAEVLYAPVSKLGQVVPELWQKYLKEQFPNIVILTHASNVTGSINNVSELFCEAKAIGAITVLDASQTIGLVDFKDILPYTDIIVFTGHKYLLGPQGTGGFYIKEAVDFEPYITGGTGVRSDLVFMPPELPEKFEAGTPNDLGFVGLEYALKWQSNNIYNLEDMTILKNIMVDGLREAGAVVISNSEPSTPVVSFVLKNWNSNEAGFILSESFGIICRTGLHCAPKIHESIDSKEHGTIRFSLSRFNTKDEIHYVIDSVRKMIK